MAAPEAASTTQRRCRLPWPGVIRWTLTLLTLVAATLAVLSGRVLIKDGGGVRWVWWGTFTTDNPYTLAAGVLFGLRLTLALWSPRRVPAPGCCPACGYNLTGNVSGNCPECGAAARAGASGGAG